MSYHYNPRTGLEDSDTEPLWLDRIPAARTTALAAAGAGAASLVVALLASRHGWTPAISEVVLAAVALAIMLAGPVPSLALAPAIATVAVDAVAAGGFGTATLGLAVMLSAVMTAAAYVRIGIRRRDTELVVAADVVQDANRREQLARRLTRLEERSWLAAEVSRATRYEYVVALALVRPDTGPASVEHTGLERLAGLVSGELRTGDAALRQDGATFAIVLPYTPAEGARVVGERVRLAVGAAHISRAPTVSVGIASFPADAESVEELTRSAERALARAVASGGNRTFCASLDGESPRGWTIAGSQPR